MARRSGKRKKGTRETDYHPDPGRLEELAARIRPMARLRVRLTYVVLLIFLIFGGAKSITGMYYLILGTILIMTGSFQRFGAAATLVKASGGEEDELITIGPYGKCRHPLYFGSFLMGLGFAFLAGPLSDALREFWPSGAESLLSLLPWGLVPLLLILAPVYNRMMSIEEAYLVEKFGPMYLRYQEKTPRFIPRLNVFTRDPGWVYDSAKLKKNREQRNFIGVMIVWVLFFAKMLYNLFSQIPQQ